MGAGLARHAQSGGSGSGGDDLAGALLDEPVEEAVVDLVCVGGGGGGELALGAEGLVAPEAVLEEDDELSLADVEEAREVGGGAVREGGLEEGVARGGGDAAQVRGGGLDVLWAADAGGVGVPGHAEAVDVEDGGGDLGRGGEGGGVGVEGCQGELVHGDGGVGDAEFEVGEEVGDELAGAGAPLDDVGEDHDRLAGVEVGGDLVELGLCEGLDGVGEDEGVLFAVEGGAAAGDDLGRAVEVDEEREEAVAGVGAGVPVAVLDVDADVVEGGFEAFAQGRCGELVLGEPLEEVGDLLEVVAHEDPLVAEDVLVADDGDAAFAELGGGDDGEWAAGLAFVIGPVAVEAGLVGVLDPEVAPAVGAEGGGGVLGDEGSAGLEGDDLDAVVDGVVCEVADLGPGAALDAELGAAVEGGVVHDLDAHGDEDGVDALCVVVDVGVVSDDEEGAALADVLVDGVDLVGGEVGAV